MLRDPGDPRSFPPEEQHEVLGLACHPLTELAAARTHWAARRGRGDVGLPAALRQQEYGRAMAEARCFQALPSAPVAAQSRSGVPTQGPAGGPLVSAAAPATILGDGHGALRPRARPGAD